MGLAVLIVSVIVLAGLDGWAVQRRRAGDRVVVPASRTPSPPPATPGDVEQALTTRLLAGRLDPDIYRDCLAAVAATLDRMSPADETRVVTGLTDGSTALVRRLAAVLPRVSEATLCAAVNLTRFGAGADDLTRLLSLSAPDALRIVTSTSGVGGNPFIGGTNMDDPISRQDGEDVGQYDEVLDEVVDLTEAFEADPAGVAEQHREIPLDDEPDR